jgi:putative ABC transport system permease protein
MTTWAFTFGEFRRRPCRTLLTVAGVAIGVAIIVAVAAAIESARASYRDLFDTVGADHSLEIVNCGAAGFEERVVANLDAIDGVRRACPRVIATTALATLAGATPARVIGLNPNDADQIRAFTLRSGQPFQTDKGIWLDARTADAHGWDVGTTVTLLAADGAVELPLLGIVEPHGAAGISGACILYLPLPTAQRLFSHLGEINSIELVLTDRADGEEVKRSVARALPAGLRVQEPGQRGALSRATLLAVQQGLTALSLIALVAAGFVVLNTVLLNLAERRKQLAILRSLGATQRQLRRLLLREAALVGLAGSAAGAGIGLLLALVFTRVLQMFLGMQLAAPQISTPVLAAAFSAGPGLTIAAAYTASRRAARLNPVYGLSEPTGFEAQPGFGRGLVVGIVLVALSALSLAGLCTRKISAGVAPDLLAPGVAGLLAGSALCFAALATPILRRLASCLNGLLGISGRIAFCQLLRRPTRTGLTSGALFIAVAAAVGFGHWLVNTLADLDRWYQHAIIADFLVRGSVPDSSFLLTAPLPERLESEIAAMADVERVDKVAFIPAQINGRSVLALVRTFAADRPPTLDLRDGNPEDVLRGLLRGEIVMASGLAQRLGVGAGDMVTLESRRGPVALRIAATAVEYAAGGDAMYIEWNTAKGLLTIPGAHAFLVTAGPGTSEALVSRLQIVCRRRQLMLQSNADLRALIDGLLERVVLSLWVLVALVFAVASLGVANTLALNVLEQAPELSVMRAVGMVSRQTKRLVLAQACLIGAVSLFSGALAGIGLAALIIQATNAVFGQQVAFRLDLPLTGGCFVVGLAITALAALVPANRAVRLAAMASGKG